MSSYKEIIAQIEDLQKKAEEVRKAEMQHVIAEVKAKIAEFGLKASDLGLLKGSDKGKRSGGTVAPKYIDPATGASWSGRGREPKWLRAAIESGKSKESFKV